MCEDATSPSRRRRIAWPRRESFLQPYYRRVPHEAALDLATRYSVTSYDARFLALAERLGTRLVTEDAKLRKAAPALTRSAAEAMASA